MLSSLTMKLPGLLSQLLQKKDKPQSRFLTLLLDVDSVQAAVWYVAANGMPQIIGTATREVEHDSWEERLEVCDRVIAMLEDKEDTTALHKVILGLPAAYLTPEGEIQPAVRSQIKKLTQVLELEPMGFVPIHQAIIYAIKKEEGVPPSAILVAVNNKSVTVSLYKVGESVGSRVIARDEQLVDNVEAMLRSFKDVEILPSRMLLYGINQGLLEEVKADLLRHPWQTKVNFLHFPKIEGLPLPASINAVSLAGASEMGQALTVGIKEEKAVQAEPEPQAEPTITPQKPTLAREEPAHIEEPEVEEEEVAAQEQEDEEEKAEAEAPEEEVEEDEEKEAPIEPEVMVVAPEAFGFKKGADILEQPLTLKSKLQKTQTLTFTF